MKSKKQNRIAVVGMACRYPDADNPQQLWENILARRVSFRKIPAVRLSDAYFSDNAADTDTTYSQKAAVLKNYVFPRDKYKISKSVFETADFAHWLALDVAAEAIEGVNFNSLNELKDVTGVFVGNTLTGEFSRANHMRLRWPYVSKVIIKQLQEEGWQHEQIEKFIGELEDRYKSPFAEMTEDSLSGGLSNTIAGRICNYFDFNGGGYTVDGACSSSLLAVSNACNAIVAGDLTIAIAGGVDLSLDPFELVGFSRAGALAKKRMLVYDKNSAGFLPGEGCGFIVLMNYEVAVKHNLNIHAVINGWGISSDGQGGLTRPTTHGQLLSFDRAYNKAGYNINDVGYIEGHGTGTKVGDETELNTITEAINKAATNGEEIFLGSVKANIGHTKAAAGIAGLMKAILCVQKQIIPPATGNKDLHPVITKNEKLKLSRNGETWNSKQPLRSSVSSMGFGGINTHVTLSSNANSKKKKFDEQENLLLSSYQNSELFLFAGETLDELKNQIQSVLNYSAQLSFAELTDLSFALFEKNKTGNYRAAIVADEPGDFTARLQLLLDNLQNEETFIDTSDGIFFAHATANSRVGFLFPGQGTISGTNTGFFETRFPELKNKYFDLDAARHHAVKHHQTEVVNHTLHALKLFEALNINADVAVGHSLGEISALHWAGVYSLKDIVELVKFRGELMTQCTGSMLSVSASAETVIPLIIDANVSLACINTHNQVVLSGSDDAIASIQQLLKQQKIPAVKLGVSGAFHSPLMQPLQQPFDEFLKSISFHSPKRILISTVLGRQLEKKDNVHQLLVDQFLHAVEFVNAIEQADDKVDYWIEAGAGKTLTAMASAITGKPIVSADIGSNDISELLKIVALHFCMNKDFTPDYLFQNRFHREFDLNWKAEFLVNPCENFVSENIPVIKRNKAKEKELDITPLHSDNILSSVKEILSRHLELSSATLNDKAKMLDDLHLNSITVGQLLARVSKQLSIPSPQTPAEYSNASIEDIANYFQNASGNKNQASEAKQIQGLHDWVKTFSIEFVEEPLLEKQITSSTSAKWFELTVGKPSVLVQQLLSQIKSLPAYGVVVALFEKSEKEIISALGQLIKILNEQKNIEHLVIVQNNNYANGFVKSVYLENKKLKTTVLTVDDTVSITSALNDIYFNKGFSEINYHSGKRFIPYLKSIEPGIQQRNLSVSVSDVVMVTGGGKGITAECALELAKKSGCKLLIVGRSDRNRDKKLDDNLLRFDAAGIKYIYAIADINNKEQLTSAINEARKIFGEITGLIHGAGVNNPISFTQLNAEKINQTVSPKVYGLKNCFAVLDGSKLKTVVTFGSIIGSSGMYGNADYALANEWMRNEVIDFKNKFSQCKCLNLEWSVWSGAGMGENLQVLEQLVNNGISPVSLDNGVNKFMDLLSSDFPSVNTIVAGRFGNLPTLKQPKVELPLLRFLEDVKVFYPGVELITEFNLSVQNDLYLADHAINGDLVFPGVMGLEAMMQCVSVILNEQTNRQIEISNIEFLQPISLKPSENLRVRILVVKNDKGEAEAAVRCESTNFLTDHFRATFTYSTIAQKPQELNGKSVHAGNAIDAGKVYENLLFHTGRFKCIDKYKYITPYSCEAVASSVADTAWYGHYYSQTNLLGNAALRDAALHAVQACVPAHTLLPVSAKQILVFKTVSKGKVQIEAQELYRENLIFCYNITIKNEGGEICEAWNEIKFSVLKSSENKKLNLPLAQIALQRKLDESIKTKSSIEFSIPQNGEILKRADGKPYLKSGENISISKQDKATMVVTTAGKTGCDVEKVIQQDTSTWRVMLGIERSNLARSISQSAKEDFSLSATRIWGVMESLKKAGDNLMSAISFDKMDEDGFLIFKSGNKKIFSFAAFIKDFNDKAIFTLLVTDDQKL